jgi:hypothetical protein
MVVLLEAHLHVSTIAAIASLLIGDKIITITNLHPLQIFIDIASRGGWGLGPHRKRWHCFGVNGILLAHLFFFFIGVFEADDIAITGWPEDVMVEVTKKFPGELLIT